MRWPPRPLLLAALLAGLAVPAAADLPLLRALVTGDSTFLLEGLDLNDRDRTLAMDSQAVLLADAAATPGTQVEWTNAQSGNAGAVVLIKSFAYDGMPCRGLEHRVKQKGNADLVNLRTARCQTADGTWKSL